MSQRDASPHRPIGWLDVARVLFVLLAVGFGWWGLRSRGAEIVDAMAQTSPGRALGACGLVTAGLLLTATVWRGFLAEYGHPVPGRAAGAIFFVGQLGKYIPGSVWALGAQADMARRLRVPARTTVAVGLLFLWAHVATALSLGAVTADLSEWPGLDSAWLRGLACAAGLLGLTPPVLSRMGSVLAKAAEPLRMSWANFGALVLTMTAVWLLYGAATVLVVPPDSLAAAGGPGSVLIPLVGAFTLSYVVGVVVILAPAGLGARELTLIALLSPAIGVAAAAATAVLLRVVHTLCDFCLAGGSWLVARGARRAGLDDPATV